jgi:diaminohydroxyphosphoribosylaminopyrimidine deaminase/5-amino-6-(5-phosphoribosylamino)uracil reductase
MAGTDSAFMQRALELAEGGRGRVSPNPLVGAVIVRDGQPIGEGFHAELGGLHAERAALEDCRARGEDPSGAAIYVTLEPCAHQGRQPPCSEALIDAGIARVAIASDDPSEKTAGRGPDQLRAAGIEVVGSDDASAEAARLLNQPFRKHAITGCPLVTLKLAMSRDGRMTTPPGASPWISGEESRALVHRWRSESDAIAVGIGTALADDPLLTARNVDGARQPLRVVFDRSARLPLDSKLLATLDQSPVLVLTAPGAPADRVDALRSAGAEVAPAPGLDAALDLLGSRQITSLFLEGGQTLANAFASADLLDETRTFVAPVLLANDPPAGGAVGGATPEEALATGGGGGSPAATGPAGGSPLASTSVTIGDDTLTTVRYKEW